MNLTPFKYLLVVENITTVFRNYLYFKKSIRIIIIFWVLIELSTTVFSIVINFQFKNKFQVQAQRIYFASTGSFACYILIASIYYSEHFYSLILNFDEFYKIIDDESYNRKMIKAQRVITSLVVSFCCFTNIFITYFRVIYSDDFNGSILYTVLFQYINFMCDFRYFMQYFMLNCVLYVVSEQMKAITRSIDSELTAIKGNQRNAEHAENLSSAAVNHDKLNKWVKAYENINISSNLCNSMFSVQLTIMLLMVTLYYILLMYSMVIVAFEGLMTLAMLLVNLLSLTVFLSTLLVMSYAGQQIQNTSMVLRQKLCELCLHTQENEEYYKLTKDLLRCVRTRPVYVHVFGTLDVNMSMLPSVVTFFTTYTVIALQFNNVL